VVTNSDGVEIPEVQDTPQPQPAVDVEFPGMIGKTVTELKHLVNMAQAGSDAVGIDKAAQSLADMVKGSYGDDVLAMFTFPTMETLVSLGVTEVVDWDRGNDLAKKVGSYLALAEDFGLNDDQVFALNQEVEYWKSAQPKAHKAKSERSDGPNLEQAPDIPFAFNVTYKDGTEVGRFGTRSGNTRWSQAWAKVKSAHYIPTTNESVWPESVKQAMAEGKAKLLEGADSVQVWDYVVTRIPSE
jgi:hypothetical protein